MTVRWGARLTRLGLRLRGQLLVHGDPGPPAQAHLCTTDRCNLSCRQCDIWRKRPDRELSDVEWKRVLDDLRGLGGPMSVNFAGGEPFARDDTLELMRYAVQQGFTVSASTNGTLIDAGAAEALFEMGADIVYVSLDGATAATHDRLRNRPGVFERVMEALEHLGRFPRPRVVLATILHGDSIEELPALMELVSGRDLQIVFQPLYQTFGQAFDPNWHHNCELLPRDFEALDRELDRLIAIRRADGPVCNEVSQLEAFKAYFRAPTLANGLSCRAGFRDIAFDPYGNVMMCYHLEPVGNVLEKGVSEIWWGRDAALRRQEVAGCQRTCNLQNCNFDSWEV